MSKQTVTCNDMFFRHGSEWVPSLLVVLYFKSSQIYLFDRILVTSCFSAKTDICFKISEFMFHNSCFTIKQMIKYSHFRPLKIITYLNIALEGRLSIFIYFSICKSVWLRNETREASLFSDIEDISKITGINTASKRMHKNRAALRDQHTDWNFLLQSWAEFINRKRWITGYLITPSGL